MPLSWTAPSFFYSSYQLNWFNIELYICVIRAIVRIYMCHLVSQKIKDTQNLLEQACQLSANIIYLFKQDMIMSSNKHGRWYSVYKYQIFCATFRIFYYLSLCFISFIIFISLFLQQYFGQHCWLWWCVWQYNWEREQHETGGLPTSLYPQQ